MKLICSNCGNRFNGTVSYDNLGWHSSCPDCGGSFDVDVPDEIASGKFVCRNCGNNKLVRTRYITEVDTVEIVDGKFVAVSDCERLKERDTDYWCSQCGHKVLLEEDDYE